MPLVNRPLEPSRDIDTVHRWDLGRLQLSGAGAHENLQIEGFGPLWSPTSVVFLATNPVLEILCNKVQFGLPESRIGQKIAFKNVILLSYNP